MSSLCFPNLTTARVSLAGWQVHWHLTPWMWSGPAWWTSVFCQEAQCTKEPWTGWCRRGEMRASSLCIRDSGPTGCDWGPGTSLYPSKAPARAPGPSKLDMNVTVDWLCYPDTDDWPFFLNESLSSSSPLSSSRSCRFNSRRVFTGPSLQVWASCLCFYLLTSSCIFFLSSERWKSHKFGKKHFTNAVFMPDMWLFSSFIFVFFFWLFCVAIW